MISGGELGDDRSVLNDFFPMIGKIFNFERRFPMDFKEWREKGCVCVVGGGRGEAEK